MTGEQQPNHPGTKLTIDPEAINHCLEKIRSLAETDDPGRRELLQLGYNLGRLGELTGGGRGPFWDRWKGPVSAWDRPVLRRLALELHDEFGRTPILETARPPDPQGAGPPGPISGLAP